MTEEDEAFAQIEKAQGWRKRQTAICERVYVGEQQSGQPGCPGRRRS